METVTIKGITYQVVKITTVEDMGKWPRAQKWAREHEVVADYILKRPQGKKEYFHRLFKNGWALGNPVTI